MSVWQQIFGPGDALAPLRQAAAASRELAETPRTTAESPVAPHVAPGQSAHAMAHAWLLTGPEESTRTRTALAFAAALECTNPHEIGCGTCPACRSTLALSNTDVKLVTTTGTTIPIDEIRTLVLLAQQAPTEHRWRVIIIEDLARVAERSSNLLLKSIEEPPPHTVWILSATHLSDALPTIRSRCRHLTLSAPSIDEVSAVLVREEGADPLLAREAAKMSRCKIDEARTLVAHPDLLRERSELERRILGLANVQQAVLLAADVCAQAKQQAELQAEQRLAAAQKKLYAQLGEPDSPALDHRARLLVRRSARELEETAKREKTRHERDFLDQVLIDAFSLWRDLYALTCGLDENELVNSALLEPLRHRAQRVSTTGALTQMEATSQARKQLAANGAPLLVLEALLAGYALQR